MKQQKILKKELNKKIKQYKSKLKQYFNICSWVEFESVEDNAIKINNSKYLLGLKIIPPKLSGADELEKLEWIDRYNRVLNSTPLEIYHYTILSPINVDAEINSLTNQIKNEDDYEIIKLLQNEINNYETLSIHNQKSEFFEMFVGNINNKRFIKECDDLKRTFLREGFEVEMLNRLTIAVILTVLKHTSILYHLMSGLTIAIFLVSNTIGITSCCINGMDCIENILL